MKESLDDKVSRLRAMIGVGQQAWDLSPNDQAAIALAVRVLSVIQYADKHQHMIETYDVETDAGDGRPFLLVVGSTASTDRETYGNTLLECFSQAGMALK